MSRQQRPKKQVPVDGEVKKVVDKLKSAFDNTSGDRNKKSIKDEKERKLVAVDRKKDTSESSARYLEGEIEDLSGIWNFTKRKYEQAFNDLVGGSQATYPYLNTVLTLEGGDVYEDLRKQLEWLLIAKCRVNPSSAKIDNIFVFISELILRLVLLALSTDSSEGDDYYIDVAENFTRNVGAIDGVRGTPFGTFLGRDFPGILKKIKKAYSQTQLLIGNRKGIENLESVLKNLKDHVLITLATFISPKDLISDFTNSIETILDTGSGTDDHRLMGETDLRIAKSRALDDFKVFQVEVKLAASDANDYGTQFTREEVHIIARGIVHTLSRQKSLSSDEQAKKIVAVKNIISGLCKAYRCINDRQIGMLRKLWEMHAILSCAAINSEYINGDGFKRFVLSDVEFCEKVCTMAKQFEDWNGRIDLLTASSNLTMDRIHDAVEGYLKKFTKALSPEVIEKLKEIFMDRARSALLDSDSSKHPFLTERFVEGLRQLESRGSASQLSFSGADSSSSVLRTQRQAIMKPEDEYKSPASSEAAEEISEDDDQDEKKNGNAKNVIVVDTVFKKPLPHKLPKAILKDLTLLEKEIFTEKDAEVYAKLLFGETTYSQLGPLQKELKAELAKIIKYELFQLVFQGMCLMAETHHLLLKKVDSKNAAVKTYDTFGMLFDSSTTQELSHKKYVKLRQFADVTELVNWINQIDAKGPESMASALIRSLAAALKITRRAADKQPTFLPLIFQLNRLELQNILYNVKSENFIKVSEPSKKELSQVWEVLQKSSPHKAIFTELCELWKNGNEEINLTGLAGDIDGSALSFKEPLLLMRVRNNRWMKDFAKSIGVELGVLLSPSGNKVRQDSKDKKEGAEIKDGKDAKDSKDSKSTAVEVKVSPEKEKTGLLEAMTQYPISKLKVIDMKGTPDLKIIKLEDGKKIIVSRKEGHTIRNIQNHIDEHEFLTFLTKSPITQFSILENDGGSVTLIINSRDAGTISEIGQIKIVKEIITESIRIKTKCNLEKSIEDNKKSLKKVFDDLMAKIPLIDSIIKDLSTYFLVDAKDNLAKYLPNMDEKVFASLMPAKLSDFDESQLESLQKRLFAYAKEALKCVVNEKNLEINLNEVLLLDEATLSIDKEPAKHKNKFKCAIKLVLTLIVLLKPFKILSKQDSYSITELNKLGSQIGAARTAFLKILSDALKIPPLKGSKWHRRIDSSKGQGNTINRNTINGLELGIRQRLKMLADFEKLVHQLIEHRNKIQGLMDEIEKLTITASAIATGFGTSSALSSQSSGSPSTPTSAISARHKSQPRTLTVDVASARRKSDISDSEGDSPDHDDKGTHRLGGISNGALSLSDRWVSDAEAAPEKRSLSPYDQEEFATEQKEPGNPAEKSEAECYQDLQNALALWSQITEKVTEGQISKTANSLTQKAMLTLIQEVKSYGFNCADLGKENNFFQVVAHQLKALKIYKDQSANYYSPEELRDLVAAHILKNFGLYQGASSKWDDFIQKISKKGMESDYIVMMALSRELNVNLAVIQSGQPNIFRRPVKAPTLCLGYMIEYSSLYFDKKLKATKNLSALINSSKPDDFTTEAPASFSKRPISSTLSGALTVGVFDPTRSSTTGTQRSTMQRSHTVSDLIHNNGAVTNPSVQRILTFTPHRVNVRQSTLDLTATKAPSPEVERETFYEL